MADNLRAHRGGDPTDVELFDWAVRTTRPDLFRWLLELSGGRDARPGLVTAAVASGQVTDDDAGWLSEPFPRPAWADGEVAWEVDEVVVAGQVDLPDGQLSGGDPFWSGGDEGHPWVVEVPPGRHPVSVVVAAHPLHGLDCAALHVVVDPTAEVDHWSLVRTRYDQVGYTSEVSLAALGAVRAFDSLSIDSTGWDFSRERPAWATFDAGGAGGAGSVVFCSVRGQHPLCRTWLGRTADGRPVQAVTDLGLLDLDLERDQAHPWPLSEGTGP